MNEKLKLIYELNKRGLLSSSTVFSSVGLYNTLNTIHKTTEDKIFSIKVGE